MIPLRFIPLVFAVQFIPLAPGAEPAKQAPAPGPTTQPIPAKADPKAEATDFLRFIEDDEAESDFLQTAIVTYTSPAGISVDLVGAIHIADAAYFEALNTRFKSYDVVLYELVGRPMVEREELKPGDGHGKLQWLGQVQETLRKTLKLESQLRGIDYTAPNFVHADMSVEGFFKTQESKQETFLSLWLKAIQAQNALPRDRPQPSMLELIRILRQEDPSMDLKRMMGEEFDSMEQLITGIEANGGTTIIGERNRHALEVMDREIQAGKIRLAIFYGAAHLPDMEERLLQRGYTPKKTEWITAWNIPWDEE
jgi:hypothetical protein